jgi:hypothetical protein
MVDHSQRFPEATGAETESAIAQFAEDVAGALLSPSKTMRSLGEREAIIPAIMLVLLIAGISALGQFAVIMLNLGPLAALPGPVSGAVAGPLLATQLVSVLWNIVWAPVLWTIVAAMLYGVAYLLDGRGRFPALWAASGFALAPQLLVAPLGTANELLGWLGTGWQLLGLVVLLPVAIGAFFWTLGLFAIAVRETMALSTGRAVGSVAILIGGLFLIITMIICVFILVIAALVGAFVA